MSDPWADIGRPKHRDAFVLRRADANHPLDFFRGRDWWGRYVFRFHGCLEGPGSLELPRLGSIELEIERAEPGAPEGWQLCLTLLDSTQADIFRALCADLMQSTANLGRQENSAGLQLIVARLNRWQRLLATRRDRLLSWRERVGLFGELLILAELWIPSLGGLQAVRSWRGPYEGEQDFLHGNWMMEAKSQVATNDGAIRISSADQLDDQAGRIILCHQMLGLPQAGDEQSMSLNQLVNTVADDLGNRGGGAGDLFQTALLEYGYSKRDEYDADLFFLMERTFFEIRQGFPRIVPSMLPHGVDSVEYSIRTSACQEFRVEGSEVLSWIFENDE